jgi:glycosyltransferase involved in cell wall biosynthesis
MFEVLSGLRRLGAEVTLVHQTDGNLLPAYDDFLNGRITVSGPFNLHWRSLAASFVTLLKVFGLTLRQQFDVIYVNQHFDAPVPAALSKLTGIPMVVHLRLPPVVKTISRQYLAAINAAKKLITISQHTRQQWIDRHISAPLHVIYNGTDLEHFAVQPARASCGVIRVLYLGRVVPDKGVHLLVEACANIAVTAEVSLTVAGDPFPNEETRAYHQNLMARAAGLPIYARFLQHQHDVRPLLAEADVLVLPSLWEEPFGRSLIEALASGVPAVGTRVGGIPEVLCPGFEDHVAEPGSVESLATTILHVAAKLRNDPALRQSCRAHVANHFDSRDTHAAIFAVLSDVLP